MKAAIENYQPVFIDVVTEPEVDNLPPVFSRHKAAGNE
jgi:hypothetical protein